MTRPDPHLPRLANGGPDGPPPAAREISERARSGWSDVDGSPIREPMQMDALRLALLVASALAPGCSAPSDSSFDGNDTGETLTWCDAEPILQNKCQRCHRDPPENGAPFALITYADTQVKHDTTPRYELMQAAVANGFMPFVAADLDPPVAPLTCEEKETLLAWLAADAPAAPSDDPECDEVVPQELSCP